jgi:uncharacterized membrane protein YeiB
MQSKSLKRIDTLDYIRGFALCGIIFMNIDVLAMIDSRTGGPISHLIAQIKPYVFEQRFYVIFSFLFGVGFYLFLSRAEQKKRKWAFNVFSTTGCTRLFRSNSPAGAAG